VEEIYKNACKRVSGLKLISDLCHLPSPQYIFTDTINWFCSALRGNKNKIAHYMDDIKGEGTYLENKTRMFFFKVLETVVRRLRETTDAKTVHFYLKNALEWRFLGRDHKDLLQLGIF
jgi:hypothetical protein